MRTTTSTAHCSAYFDKCNIAAHPFNTTVLFHELQASLDEWLTLPH